VHKVTAIIPCFNEEHNIAAAIESVQWADEIIVVDSFSTDNTPSLVQQYKVKFVQHTYENSAAQKNWIIPQASHEWVFLLDADERVTPSLKQEILQLLATNSRKEDGFWIKRSNDFMGRRIRYSGWQGDKVIRLFRKECRYEDKRVHAEIITASGNFGKLNNPLQHNTYVSFDHYVYKLNRYAWWQANDLIARGKTIVTPYHILIKPGVRFFKHYIIEGGILDGFPGFVIAALQAYAVATRYVKVWLLKRGIEK
jgi:glycosyltransferase involved in cell wall biosynthesis